MLDTSCQSCLISRYIYMGHKLHYGPTASVWLLVCMPQKGTMLGMLMADVLCRFLQVCMRSG